MKKFFKALALVLALTLVIGVIPASAADAKVATSKLLYIGGAQGVSADGTDASTVKAKVAIYKLAGYTKDTKVGHKFAAEVTGKEGVVEITKNYVVAAGMGTTTIDILVDGEVAGTTKVTVKKNAEETIALTGLEDGQEVVAGQTVTVSLPRSGKDTDARRLLCNGVAVAENADAPRTFDVKFPAVGEYKIVGEAFQSAKYDGATGSATVTVKAVAPKAVSAKQVSANSFAITFESDMTGLISKDNFGADSLYTKVGDVKIAQGLVKDVKVEAEVVTVIMYANLAADTQYFYTDARSNEVAFTSAKNVKEAVDHIKVSVDTAYKDEYAAITVKYFNADGVELAIPAADVTAYLTLEVTDTDSATLSGNNVYFFAADKTATVKAKFLIGFDSVTYESIYKEDSTTVTSTTRSAANVVSYKYSLDGTPANEKHSVRIDDAAADLKVNYVYDNNTESGTINYSDGTYKLVSSDEKIVMIQSNKIVGVNTGNAVVIVYERDDSGNFTKVVRAFNITVAPKNNNLASVTLGTADAKYNLNVVAGANPGAVEPLQIKYVVKDSDGADKSTSAGVKVYVKQVTNNATVSGYDVTEQDAVDNATGIINVTIAKNGNWATAKNGAVVSFVVTLKDANGTQLDTKTYAVQVADYDGTQSNVRYALKGEETALDATLKFTPDGKANGELQKTAKVSVVKTVDGFDCGTADFTELTKLSDLPTAVTRSAIAGETVNGTYSYNYLVVTTPEGIGAANTAITYTGAANARTLLSLNNLESAKQAKAGTYTVIGYRLDYKVESGVATLAGRNTIGSVSISVVDNTVAPTVAVIGNVATSADSYRATWNGVSSSITGETPVTKVTVAGPTGAQCKVDSTSLATYVYKVTVTVTADTFGTKTFDVDVNKLFK